MSGRRRIRWWMAIPVTCLVAAAVVTAVWLHRAKHIVIRGAVIKQDTDPKKQSPIANVQISVVGASIPIATKSDFSGYFRLRLPPDVRPGQSITLQFRDPEYQPIDRRIIVDDKLYVVGMEEVVQPKKSPPGPVTRISNIKVRYTTETTNAVNIGSEVTTFQVKSQANLPCNQQDPCSPDGKWKAALGTASLDAGQGNFFDDARVSCIAGPCPFTKIVSDRFSRSSRVIGVSVLGWSDTTTFLLQGEVFRREISDIVRELYPVIFGESINFSLPPQAEGPCFEAEFNSTEIIFPLGPAPELSWADCNVEVRKNNSKSYRCELKQGYRIGPH
jgi:hypothetical protein